MPKRRVHEQAVQKTGNVLRTVMIWSGLALALVAAVLVMTGLITERVGFYLLVATAVAYGFALFDFDVDDVD